MSRLIVTVCVVSGSAGRGRIARGWRAAGSRTRPAYTFTVSSGNVSNQRVGAHTTTTIEAGKIQGKSAEGKTISGACKDGGDLVIQEKNGVPLLLPKKRPRRSRSRRRSPRWYSR